MALRFPREERGRRRKGENKWQGGGAGVRVHGQSGHGGVAEEHVWCRTGDDDSNDTFFSGYGQKLVASDAGRHAGRPRGGRWRVVLHGSLIVTATAMVLCGCQLISSLGLLGKVHEVDRGRF